LPQSQHLAASRSLKHLPGKTAILFLLAVAAIFPCAAFCQTSEEQIGSLFQAGQEALKRGEFVRATEDFKKVLALDPTLLEAEVNLGLAYQSLLEYDFAVRHLTKALRERPNLLGPTVIVGMDYLKLGSPEKAIPFLQRALKLDPANREAHQALASSYLGQEDYRSAAEEFRQVALLDSDKSEAWFTLGHQYLDLSGRLAYRGARLYRESPWGHRFLGDLLLQRDRSDDALKEYRKALEAAPQQPGLHSSMGQVFLHAAKWDEAEKEFRAELQAGARNEQAWLGLANLQLAKGQPGAALESVGKAWEISPEFLAVQKVFPSVEISTESAAAFIKQLQNEPDSAAKHFLLAALFSNAGDNTSADQEWKAFQASYLASQQAPNNAAATTGPDDACKAHRYAACADSLKKRPNLDKAERLLLGKTYFALQQYEPAADAFAQVRGVSNENAEASYWLERSYQALGADCYAQLEQAFPNSWRTHQLRGEGYAIRLNFDDALKEFQMALQLRPEEAQLHEALGDVYVNKHDDEDAQKELEKTLSLDPSRTHALYLLGRLYVSRRENEKAVSYLQRALRLQPDLAEASGLLGTTYVRLGQFAKAVPKLEKAASLDHYGNVHYQLYLAYRKLGQTELAQKALARSQDLRRSSLEHDQAVIMGSPQIESEPQ
jgi:tetratricopeptide (TPR) repeat protein